MTVHWTALGIGFVVGAVVAYCAKGRGWAMPRIDGLGQGHYGPARLGVIR